MPEFGFGLIVTGVDLTGDDVVNALLDAGVEDATFAVRDGSHVVYLDREGNTLLEAVASAVRELESAHPGLCVVGFEGNELLTQAGVAEVAGRTRQSIHQRIRGVRGSTRAFPPALGWADASRPLWLRSDIEAWGQGEAWATWPTGEPPVDAQVVFAALLLGRSLAQRSDLAEGALQLMLSRMLALRSDREGARNGELVDLLRATADRIQQKELDEEKQAETSAR